MSGQFVMLAPQLVTTMTSVIRMVSVLAAAAVVDDVGSVVAALVVEFEAGDVYGAEVEVEVDVDVGVETIELEVEIEVDGTAEVLGVEDTAAAVVDLAEV